MIKHGLSIEERFWMNVDKRGANECWEWKEPPNHHGYGRFYNGNGKEIRAHRYSYILAFGEIPKGICVCHDCDNRLCVNPLHLFLGTNNDNVTDRVKKGRGAFGEKQGNAKLTHQQVVEIKQLLSSGTRMTEIAKHFYVNASTIHDIKHGRSWKHVAVD